MVKGGRAAGNDGRRKKNKVSPQAEARRLNPLPGARFQSAAAVLPEGS